MQQQTPKYLNQKVIFNEDLEEVNVKLVPMTTEQKISPNAIL